jgi:hypothetical protein
MFLILAQDHRSKADFQSRALVSPQQLPRKAGAEKNIEIF